ncbi:hypothetical protein K0B96_03400 [Horticoccus luteus]|uniref:Uncharacterized protein n=1 Tax=Horticoccus luteus TaxID=2862869 RepID=A0A8F9TUU2_9BACT|nr:hypothetical protein [Horticoccus luteus]QYM79679.1 hypothetical protein K0B96_03400 [Horticoccus luteus]
MHKILFIGLAVVGLWTSRAGAADEAAEPDPLQGAPAPLAAAIRKYAEDTQRWAFTQHTLVYDKNGKLKEERRSRFDPSVGPEERWTLLERDGKAPDDSAQRKFRRERAKQRLDRSSLGELLEVKRAAVVADEPAAITYEVPLRSEGNWRLPPDKFTVLIRVARQKETLESVDVKLRAPMRVKLVAKIKRGGALLTFTAVDDKHAAPLTEIKADGAGSIFFVPVSASYDLTRSDFKRVKPWDERFGVKIGPLKVLDY